MAICVAAAASLALLAGCHSGAQSSAQQVQMQGPGGKVYSGSQNQVTTQVGQDYGQGLKAMASQRSK